MICCIAIFFLCFQLIQIFVIVTAKCYQSFEFWIDSRAFGFNPFSLSSLTFILFIVWAFVELLISFNFDSSSKWRDITPFLLVVICSVGSLAVLKTQYEFFEISWKERSAKQYTFPMLNFPDDKWVDPWREFIKDKECSEPGFDCKKVESLEDYEKLEQEFFDKGGTHEWQKVPIDS